MESTKFDLFYYVSVEKNILEGLGRFGTPFWFRLNSKHTYGF